MSNMAGASGTTTGILAWFLLLASRGAAVKGQGRWAHFKEGAAKLKRKYQQSDENPYQCFRLGQCCSWFVILLCFIVFVVSLGSLSAADHARTIICKRPEIAAGLNSNVTTCEQVVSCFAECNDQYDVVSTKGFRDCFLGNADRSVGSPLVVDSPCTLEAGTVAYNVARYYRNSSVDADLARLRFREEVMLSYAPPRPVDAVPGVSSRRRQAAEVRPPLPARRELNPVALAWAMTVDIASASFDSDDAIVAAAARAADALHRFYLAPGAAGSAERRLVQSTTASSIGGGGSSSRDGSLLGPSTGKRQLAPLPQTPQEELVEASANTAAAVGITFIVSGKLSFMYGWVATLAVLLMVPACMFLYALGVCGKHLCKKAGSVEVMHNGSMQWAFHLSWILGTAFLLVSACMVTKFQILLRYYTTKDAACDSKTSFCASAATAGSRLEKALGNPGAVAAVAVPCVLGMLSGFFPVCLAMIISRSRTIRNEAMAKDQHYQQRLQKPGKELSAPQPVLQGPPPNLAMLNPVFETGSYAQNYASSTNASGGSEGGTPSRYSIQP